jgi:hypothetical protein
VGSDAVDLLGHAAARLGQALDRYAGIGRHVLPRDRQHALGVERRERERVDGGQFRRRLLRRRHDEPRTAGLDLKALVGAIDVVEQEQRGAAVRAHQLGGAERTVAPSR